MSRDAINSIDQRLDPQKGGPFFLDDVTCVCVLDSERAKRKVGPLWNFRCLLIKPSSLRKLQSRLKRSTSLRSTRKKATTQRKDVCLLYLLLPQLRCILCLLKRWSTLQRCRSRRPTISKLSSKSSSSRQSQVPQSPPVSSP